MQPIGNKYLIKVEQKSEDVVNGIVLPSIKKNEEVYYEGVIESYGTHMIGTELIPIGTCVYFDWKNKNAKTRLQLNNGFYYICEPNSILAIKE